MLQMQQKQETCSDYQVLNWVSGKVSTYFYCIQENLKTISKRLNNHRNILPQKEVESLIKVPPHVWVQVDSTNAFRVVGGLYLFGPCYCTAKSIRDNILHLEHDPHAVSNPIMGPCSKSDHILKHTTHFRWVVSGFSLLVLPSHCIRHTNSNTNFAVHAAYNCLKYKCTWKAKMILARWVLTCQISQQFKRKVDQ